MPKQRNIKFLGGLEAFTPEQLAKAASVASELVVRGVGDRDTPAITEAEKEALGGLLDMLGLVLPTDHRNAHGGRSVGSLTMPKGD